MRMVGNLQDSFSEASVGSSIHSHTVTVNSLLPGPVGPPGVEGSSWTVPSVS